MQTHYIQLMRNRKYDMKMFYRKGSLHKVVNPEYLFGSLAFGAVSVATAIVAITYRGAIVTHFFVPAKS
jgi:hypothetical protein